MSDCIFCSIVAGEAGGEHVYRDDEVTAFADVNPRAPLHLLVVPNRHVTNVDETDDADILAKLLLVARDLGKQHSPEHGYRILINGGAQAEVAHVHLHVLGGQAEFDWPPLQGR